MRFLACALSVGAMALSTGCGSAGVSHGTGGQPGTSGNGAAGTTSASTSGTTTTTTGGTGGAAGTSSSATSSASGSGGATSSSIGSGGATSSSGDCTVDADCPGGKCVPITPGGFRLCQTPPQKATVCDQPGMDQCCAGMPCPNNEPCYAGPLIPICAGIPMAPHNQCAVDQCTKDADCAMGQICGLAGALGAEIRACIHAACKVDGDCAAMAGGKCAPVNEPCCGVNAGLYCVYASGGCRRNANCAPAHYCRITGPSASCQPGSPVCPQ